MSSWKLIRATIYQALVAYLLLTHFNHFKYLREVGTWDGKGSTRRQTSVTFSQVLSESILYCALITLWNQRIERHHFIPNEMQICTNIHCAHSPANSWLLTPDVSHEIAKDFVYKQFHPINYLFGFQLKDFTTVFHTALVRWLIKSCLGHLPVASLFYMKRPFPLVERHVPTLIWTVKKKQVKKLHQ